MIKLLIVDDSPTAQANLEYIFQSDPEFKIVGIVGDGEEAIKFLEDNEKPDVITMDVVMPKMNGFEATKIIMEKNPIPIVIVSSSNSKDEVDKSFLALDAGALALMGKPGKVGNLKNYEIRNLISTVKTMSKVSLVKRWAKDKYSTKNVSGASISDTSKKNFEIVVIGVSTGGPPALQQLLTDIPSDFFLPIVIVQHIAQGFVKGMADWLNSQSKLNILVAEKEMKVMPGNVYLACDGYQMGIDSNHQIYLEDAEEDFGIKPSVAFLFRSVLKNINGRIIAILLTGMGKDGSAELKNLKDAGALTIIQDEKSSVVFGMPGVAKSLNAQKMELNPEEIGKELINIHNRFAKKNN